jgi:hypothetical protein
MIKAVTSTLALLAFLGTANAGTPIVVPAAPVKAPAPIVVPPAPVVAPKPIVVPPPVTAPVVVPGAVAKPNPSTVPVGTVVTDINGAKWIVGTTPLGNVWNKY